MAKPTYYELLRDPRWQRKRLEVMQAADFACVLCGDKSTTLNVHHDYYTKGAMPWDYPASALKCLCETCHEKRHVKLRDINAVMAHLDNAVLDEVLGYVLGKLLQNSSGDVPKIRLDNAEVISGVADSFPLYNSHLGASLFYLLDAENNLTFENYDEINMELFRAANTFPDLVAGVNGE
jgi:hypothetical protein